MTLTYSRAIRFALDIQRADKTYNKRRVEQGLVLVAPIVLVLFDFADDVRHNFKAVEPARRLLKVYKNYLVAVAAAFAPGERSNVDHVKRELLSVRLIRPPTVLLLDQVLQREFLEGVRVNQENVFAVAVSILGRTVGDDLHAARVAALAEHFLVGGHVHKELAHIFVLLLRARVYLNALAALHVLLAVALHLLQVWVVAVVLAEPVMVVLLVLGGLAERISRFAFVGALLVFGDAFARPAERVALLRGAFRAMHGDA